MPRHRRVINLEGQVELVKYNEHWLQGVLINKHFTVTIFKGNKMKKIYTYIWQGK